MLTKLFPQTFDFYTLFESHAELIVKAAHGLSTCVQANMDVNWITEIKNYEHEADSITRKCLESLHSTFITPIDRDDIHRLIVTLDNIMDTIDGIADDLFIYKIHTAKPEFIELCDLLEKSTIEVQKGIKGLRDMTHGDLIRTPCETIYQLEHDADTCFKNAVGKLFSESNDPKEIIKWKDLYQGAEIATDRCNDVADVLESILLENA